MKKLQLASNCLPKCQFTKYEYTETTKEEAAWNKAWISAFYLAPSSPSYSVVTESYRYSLQTVFTDFGSYSGLYIGWSLLTIAGPCPPPA
jgi:hypothetical protein